MTMRHHYDYYREVAPTEKMREAVENTPRHRASGEITRFIPRRPVRLIGPGDADVVPSPNGIETYEVWNDPVPLRFDGVFAEAIKYRAGDVVFLKLRGCDVYLKLHMCDVFLAPGGDDNG